jgi:hypothetical protein
VVALTVKENSGWSRSWGIPDVEMVVVFDKPRLGVGSRLSGLGYHHIEAVEPLP